MHHPHLSSAISMGRAANYNVPVVDGFKWAQQVPSQEGQGAWLRSDERSCPLQVGPVISS